MALPMLEERRVKEQQAQPQYIRSPASPETFGSQVGEALAGLGNQAFKIAAEEKQKADAFAAAELDMQFSSMATDLLYNTESGFLAKQGGAALDVAPVTAEFDRLQEKISQQARTPEQQRAFLARSSAQRVTLEKQVEAHSTQQRQKYYTSIADGTAKGALEQAALFYQKPEAVRDVIEHALPVLRLYWATNEGLSGVDMAAREKAFRADMHGAVLRAYLAKDQGVKGLAYLSSVREQMGASAAEFERLLGPVADKEIGKAAGEEAFQASFGTVQSNMNVPSLTEGMTKLRAIATAQKFTQDQFDSAKQALDSNIDLWRKGYAMDGDTLMATAHSEWEAAGYNLAGVSGHVETELRARGEWPRMVELNRTWHDRKEPPTPAQKMSLVSFMIGLAQNPEEYDSWTIDTFRSRLAPYLHRDDIEQAGALLSQYQRRPERWNAGLQPVMRMMEQMGASKEINAFPQFRDKDVSKRDVKQWTDQDQINVYYEAASRVQNWLVEWHKNPKNKGVSPTMDEYRVFLEDMFAKGKDPDGGWFGNKKTTKLQAEVLGTGFEAAEDPPPGFVSRLKANWPGYAGPFSMEIAKRAWRERVNRPGSKPTKDDLMKQQLEAEAIRSGSASLLPGP